MTIAAGPSHRSRSGGPPPLVLLLLIVFAASRAYPIEATAPKLGSPPAAAASGDTDPAQALPMRVTVCIDRSARRCWTGAAGEQCEAFVTLPANSPNLGRQLRACWDSVAE